MKSIILFGLVLFLCASCGSQKEAVPTAADNSKNARNKSGQRQRPSLDDIFKMDVNGDGLLDKSELKGPLLERFEKIDTNGDGFISREELEKAPKPQRGQRGGRN